MGSGRLNLCQNNGLLLTEGNTGLATQTVLRTSGIGMSRNLKYVTLAHPGAFPTGVTTFGVHVDKVDFEVPGASSHTNRLRRHERSFSRDPEGRSRWPFSRNPSSTKGKTPPQSSTKSWRHRQAVPYPWRDEKPCRGEALRADPSRTPSICNRSARAVPRSFSWDG